MLNMRLQNQPAVLVKSSDQQTARSLANISGKIVEGGFPGLDSVIAGGNLNAFPEAALELLSAFWAQTPVVVRPTLKGVGTIQGYEYVANVDPGPEGFARFDEGGDRVYVWNGSDWYFGTWFGRWFKDPTNDPVDSPSSLSESIPLGIPSGTLFNSAAWQAGDAANPAGTILVPDEVVDQEQQSDAGGLVPPGPGDFAPASGDSSGSMQQVWIAAGLIGVAGFLFLRRRR